MGKIRRQYYSALKSLCYYRFFSLKSNIGRYILQWRTYLNKSKQFLNSAAPKITLFSLLNCQKTCYHQNESSCLQSRKRLLILKEQVYCWIILKRQCWNFLCSNFFYLMQTAMENFTLNFHCIFHSPLPLSSRICWNPFPPTQRYALDPAISSPNKYQCKSHPDHVRHGKCLQEGI